MRFEFEKLKSAIYPAYCHVGDYSIALNSELILSLKNSINGDRMQQRLPDASLADLIQTIGGGNRYLKGMMEAGIAAFEEKSVLVNRLCAQIESL
ncbi:MAG: hypothetical protein HY037_05185 [Nitrospirae bacterium]|nr:hypothetical protein [Candidatus Troglogloeales bacterium]